MASVSKREWTHKGTQREAWVVRYKDGGTHRSRQFKRKKEADAFRVKVEAEGASGVHSATAERMTVKFLCDEFMKGEEIRLSDGRIGRGHYRNFKIAVDTSIIPILGTKAINSLTSDDIEEFYAKMRRSGSLAPITSRERVSRLKQIFDLAVRRGWLKSNPVDAAKRQLRGIKQEPIRTLSPDDVAAILKAADVKRFRAHASTQRLARLFVHIAIFCGLRWGEIAALTIPRVKLDEGMLEVRHSMTKWDEMKSPKTRSGVRDVPIPSHLVELLREWIASDYIPNERKLLFRAPISRSGSGPGGPLYHTNFLRTHWAPLLAQAGIEANGNPVHFHALRHFSASWMILNGLPVMDVASLLGHRRFDTTLQVYAHQIVGGKARSAAFDRMAGALLAAPIAPPASPLCPA